MRDALLRTLAFHHVWGHAPTLPEWVTTVEGSPDGTTRADLLRDIEGLEADKTIVRHFGRYLFPAGKHPRENELWNSRKLRTARSVAAWLARLSSVRFVALCNTTALGHARDGGDLDFFVVTRAGSLMVTRGIGALPFKISRRRPGEGERDAVCLSYFVADDGLDLATHMLKPDDPYFRYWFLSLLPLYDDGVSADLWAANISITSRHPFARPWIVPPDLGVVRPRLRIPQCMRLEPLAARLQSRAFPPAIRDLMNRDTRVIVTEKALKFHVEDRREEFRRAYDDLCREII